MWVPTETEKRIFDQFLTGNVVWTEPKSILLTFYYASWKVKKTRLNSMLNVCDGNLVSETDSYWTHILQNYWNVSTVSMRKLQLFINMSTIIHIFTISGANIHDFDMQNKSCIQCHTKSKYSKWPLPDFTSTIIA
jgi:hypothetical protein